MSKHTKLFFGKYRGKVENTVDPMMLGRIQVSCPVVLGQGTLSWAMPCTPYAGNGLGWFAIPPKGANVWVEFEGGDPDYPIWAGCFWGIGEVPAQPAMEHIKMLKTDSLRVTIDDMQSVGGVTVELDAPGVDTLIKLVWDSKGVELTTGDSRLTFTAEDIEHAVGSDTNAKLSADGIEMKGASESTMNLAESEITAANGDSTVTIASDKIENVCGSSESKMESSAIEQKNGSKSVKIESSKVTVNGSSLEVM